MSNETMREFNTANYTVRVTAVEDNDLDLSFDDDGLVAEGLDSGKFIAFGAVATVYHRTTGIELGSDSIWGCIYESFDAFMDHRACGVQNREYAAKGETGRCGSYFTQIISGAIAEARKTANELTFKLRTV